MTLSLVYGYGNLISYAMGSSICEELGFIRNLVTSSGQLQTLLRQHDYHYDLAILSKSVYVAVRKQQLPDEQVPHEILRLGSSRFELLARSDAQFEDLEEVLYFGGPSSRHALASLAREWRASGVNVRMRQIMLDTPVNASPTAMAEHPIHALLSHWGKTTAVLAKPPITRLYEQLCDCDLKTLGETTEDVLLVMSGRTHNSFPRTALDALQAKVSEVRDALSPSDAARRCLDPGCVVYVSRLLGLDVAPCLAKLFMEVQ